MRENIQIRFTDEVMISLATHAPIVIGLVTGKMDHVICDLNWDAVCTEYKIPKNVSYELSYQKRLTTTSLQNMSHLNIHAKKTRLNL